MNELNKERKREREKERKRERKIIIQNIQIKKRTKYLQKKLFRSGDNLVKLDLTDFESTRKFIEKNRPKFLIHAAAQRYFYF